MFRINLLRSSVVLCAFGGLLGAAAAMAADAPSPITAAGAFHPLPQAAYQPDRKATYKVVFSLSKDSGKPGEVNPALERVARTVNLYAASGVPLEQLKFVAVASGPATPLVLDDEHYRAKFGVANPNLPVIAQLRKAGVDIAVCGQAVAENHFQNEWVAKDVTLALSALTTITELQQQGYALMPL
ncbi:DsrE family protein [Dyella silvatica]|uniref:DsrE family protein n=1 Tax=Dyella silvatica TaxID=2992128 RepID=UPI0022577072|nr:DsrE family protein [Dyella silvatica]